MKSTKIYILSVPTVILAATVLFNIFPAELNPFFRLLVFAASIAFVWLIRTENDHWLFITFIAIAVLYIPLFPIQLSSNIWNNINALVAVFYFATILQVSDNSKLNLFTNKNAIIYYIILLMLLLTVANRWVVYPTPDVMFSYQYDRLTSYTFVVNQNNEIVRRHLLPPNAIEIRYAVTFFLYSLVMGVVIFLIKNRDK